LALGCVTPDVHIDFGQHALLASSSEFCSSAPRSSRSRSCGAGRTRSAFVRRACHSIETLSLVLQ